MDQKVNGEWIKTCWAERYDSGYDTWWEDGNVISNTTLFDYAGKPLKALWSEVASQAGGATDLEAVGGETANAVRSEKIIKDGQLFILRDGRIYNAFGVRVK